MVWKQGWNWMCWFVYWFEIRFENWSTNWYENRKDNSVKTKLLSVPGLSMSLSIEEATGSNRGSQAASVHNSTPPCTHVHIYCTIQYTGSSRGCQAASVHNSTPSCTSTIWRLKIPKFEEKEGNCGQTIKHITGLQVQVHLQ